MLENTQTAPYPDELATLVDHCAYRPGWLVLLRHEVRDPADTHGAATAGLTLSIITETINSYPPHQPMRVRHLFAVPAATYNRESWQRWLFERFLDVERHECMEFFTIDGEKPYAPNHGPGWDPYLLTTVATTEVDRATSFRGEVNATRPPLDATEASLLTGLLSGGRTNPDDWTRDERAAVTRLYGVKDGRPRYPQGPPPGPPNPPRPPHDRPVA